MDLDYHGFPDRRISTGCLSLDYLTEAGPRIVGLRLAGRGENLLAELPDVHWGSPNGEYHVYGGHRLWLASEREARTYLPDDEGLTLHESATRLELVGARQAPTGIRKHMRIDLAQDHPALTITTVW